MLSTVICTLNNHENHARTGRPQDGWCGMRCSDAIIQGQEPSGRHIINKFKTVISLTAILYIVLLIAGPASATTFEPAYRGDDNSVHAIFDWVSNEQTDWNTTLFETGQSIYPLSQVTPSASDDGLDTTIQLPNFIDPLPLKLMRIQMFFDGIVSGDLIALELEAFDLLQTSWEVVDGSGPIDSNVHYIDIEIIPNPDWEQITIFGNQGGNVLPGNLLTIRGRYGLRTGTGINRIAGRGLAITTSQT